MFAKVISLTLVILATFAALAHAAAPKVQYRCDVAYENVRNHQKPF